MASFLPSELYQDPEISERALSRREFWNDEYTLETILPPLDLAYTRGDLLEYLGSFDSTYDPDCSGAALAIGCLPPRLVVDNYGEDVLLWAAANTRIRERAAPLIKALAEFGGYDRDFMQKAINLNTELDIPLDPQLIMDDHAVMERATKGDLDKVDLGIALEAAVHPGVKLSNTRISHYSLFPLKTRESHAETAGPAEEWYGRLIDGSAYYKLYMDMPVGFTLLYKDKPQALATFRSWQRDELLVGQLQGVKGSRVYADVFKETGKISATGDSISARGLAPFEWRKLLMNICEQLAASMHKERVGIYTHGASRWISGEAAKLAYDKPALEMGFSQGEDRHWHKPLT